ncbi:MAG: Asp-tRNA(Asn)/Glu-tRNA(Gln) amidotransferase subunit GatA [Nitrospirae bacterium]|nr:Asp-tRNA(Asn)/Glu-tRNA(Gln) amidotransferase subunit GatA [Nitrospirota bacterium]
MELYRKTIHELHGLLKKREITSREITGSVFERINEVDTRVRAYLCLTGEKAFAQADRADQLIRDGSSDVSPLTGIPIAIKDLICTKGVRTTCASHILHNFTSPYNATVIDRLEKAGYVHPGMTNMDEFAMGSSTENSFYQVTRNPWDTGRVPGGSSGGSTAAVAADECIAALGSDTGGSIRQPAALCGVVGLKPTYGRVSRYGLIAFASSLDQIGPITKDVTDCAILLKAISGHDPKDSTSVGLPVPDYTKVLGRDIKGLRLGIPREYFISGIDPSVESCVKEAVRALEGLGARTVEISLPHTEYAIAAYYIIATAEASSNLARYDGVKYGYRTKDADDLIGMYMKTRDEGFGPEVKRRIMLGTYVLSAGYYDAYYRKAQQVRTLIKGDFERAFQEVDAIVTPTSPTPAFRVGERTADPLQMYLSDIFTISVNLAGIPGLSIPCGFTGDGLPVGLQILGRDFDEERILQIAYAYEQATEWRKRRPEIGVRS